MSSNVTLTCSRSGKLSTSLVQYYLENIVANEMKDDFMLIVDSWPGHVNPSLYSNVFGANNGRPNCELVVIPEKTTPFCQPLDTTFHRQLKNLARRILNHYDIFVDSAGVNKEDRITTRHGILKFQALLHHQLKAPIFEPMIRYSYYSSGLILEKDTFLNVNQVCFDFDQSSKCQKCNAVDTFIKCSHCRDVICFECFFWIPRRTL